MLGFRLTVDWRRCNFRTRKNSHYITGNNDNNTSHLRLLHRETNKQANTFERKECCCCKMHFKFVFHLDSLFWNRSSYSWIVLIDSAFYEFSLKIKWLDKHTKSFNLLKDYATPHSTCFKLIQRKNILIDESREENQIICL